MPGIIIVGFGYAELKPREYGLAPQTKNSETAGYYHYATGSNESYEETLPKVKAGTKTSNRRFCQWWFGETKNNHILKSDILNAKMEVDDLDDFSFSNKGFSREPC